MTDNPYSSPIESEPGKVFPGIAGNVKYSAMGIASFACSVMSLVVLIAGTIAAEVFTIPSDQPAAIASLALALAGIGLGISSCFQKDRRRVYGFLGLVFAIAIVLILLMLTFFQLF